MLTRIETEAKDAWRVHGGQQQCWCLELVKKIVRLSGHQAY